MDNNSIFSGAEAHPARMVADELHHHNWRLITGDAVSIDNFLDLIGAVTTLARTVDQLERHARAVDERLGPAVQSTGAHALSPATVDALRAQRLERKPPDAVRRLELVTIGLRELYQMLDDSRNREPVLGPGALRVVIDAARARLAAMLDGLES
jgi:hypothetical protein